METDGLKDIRSKPEQEEFSLFVQACKPFLFHTLVGMVFTCCASEVIFKQSFLFHNDLNVLVILTKKRDSERIRFYFITNRKSCRVHRCALDLTEFSLLTLRMASKPVHIYMEIIQLELQVFGQ